MSSTAQTPSGEAHVPEPNGEIQQGQGPRWRALLTPVLAVVLALAVGGVLIIVTNPEVRAAAGYFFDRPADTLVAALDAVVSAYVALFQGAIFDPGSVASGSFSRIARPASETIVYSTPIVLTGLSVALAFRAGLFNIGAQGQLILGAIIAGWIGFGLELPPVLHLLLALTGGVLGGALWGGIVGVLKATSGAHEVIVTIMLNWVAIYLLGFLLTTRGFQAPPFNQAKSERVLDSAALPPLLGGDLRATTGFVLALLAALALWWVLERSTPGFRLKAVGLNPAAARTAGMSVPKTYALAMLAAGALSGLAGATQALGPIREITSTVDNGAGFDGITVALLGRGKPAGVIAAGLLFGALRAGATRMQTETQTPVDLILVVQAMTVLFIAAPPLIHAVFRVRTTQTLIQTGGKGWNE